MKSLRGQIELSRPDAPLVVLVRAGAVLLAADRIFELLLDEAVGVGLAAHEPLLVAHEAVGIAADPPRVPLLEIAVAALPDPELGKVDVHDHVALARGTLLIALARQGAHEHELERGRVGNRRQELDPHLGAKVVLLPAARELGHLHRRTHHDLPKSKL